MITGQAAVVGIYRALEKQNNLPGSMTFETNGTQILKEPFKEWVRSIDTEVFFSVSPKLFTVSGEKTEKAIKPENVAEYTECSNRGQLKFVVGAADREWDEMEMTVEKDFEFVKVKNAADPNEVIAAIKKTEDTLSKLLPFSLPINSL